MVPESDLVIMYAPSTELADGLVTASLDTQGYDFCDIVGSTGTYTCTVTPTPTTLRLGQSPTAPTAQTDCTNLTSFTGGAATTTAVGFAIGTYSTNQANGFHFKVDLRGVDRYLCVEFDNVGTAHNAMYALMGRAHTSPKAQVATTTLDAVRNIAAGSS